MAERKQRPARELVQRGAVARVVQRLRLLQLRRLLRDRRGPLPAGLREGAPQGADMLRAPLLAPRQLEARAALVFVLPLDRDQKHGDNLPAAISVPFRSAGQSLKTMTRLFALLALCCSSALAQYP